MSKKTLSGSIALTKLVHSKVTTKKGAEVIVIPVEANLLEKDDNGGIYLPVRVIVTEEMDQYKQNGFIAKSIGSKAYKAADEKQKDEWKDKQKEITPILGSIKDFSGGSQEVNTGEVSVDAGTDIDDLPF